MPEQLDRAAVAERLGIRVKSVDEYRRRPDMAFPEPDGLIGRSPWWKSTTIDRWNRKRRVLEVNRAANRDGAVAAAG